MNLMYEVALIVSDGYVCHEVLQARYLASRLAERFDVPEARDALDPCGLNGAVVLVAEVLGERAPERLRALAVLILAEHEVYAARGWMADWWAEMEPLVAAARARMAPE